MNSIFEMINKAVAMINSLVNSISPSTADSIKRGYLFLIFLLSIAGIVAGMNMGKDSAKVASSPYIDTTNEAFKYSMKKEKSGGSYDELIDSELISEPALRDREKMPFQIKEEGMPETDYRIIEPDAQVKKRQGPQMSMDDRPAEGNYRPIGSEPPDVKPLDRRAPDQSMKQEGSEPSLKQKSGENPRPTDGTDIRDSVFQGDKTAPKDSSSETKPVRKLKRIGSGEASEPSPIDRKEGAVEK